MNASVENLSDRQLAGPERAITAHEAHEEICVAWRCAQDRRAAHRARDTDDGLRRATKVTASFQTCPTPWFRARGSTLRRWHEAFAAGLTADPATTGGTEAINGSSEEHRRPARY